MNLITGCKELLYKRDYFIPVVTVVGTLLAACICPFKLVPLVMAPIPITASRTFDWLRSKDSHPGRSICFEDIEDSTKHSEEFCRRIPEVEWKQTLEKMKGLNLHISPEQLEAFRKGLWEHPIFQQRDWIYGAFQAYLAGEIKLFTMCNLFLYDQCQKEIKEAHPYTDENQFKDPCSKLCGYFSRRPPSPPPLQTFQLLSPDKKTIDMGAATILKSCSGLNAQQFDRFQKSILKWEPEDTQFFLVRKNLVCDFLFDAAIAIFGPGTKFIWKKSQQDLFQVIVNPKLLQKIRSHIYGKNTILPVPVLGYSKIEKLSDYARRIIGIPSIFKTPRTLHGMHCEPLGAYHHDVYHHVVDSANIHREIWVGLAKFFKGKEQLKFCGPTIFDRELTDYFFAHPKQSLKHFWKGIVEIHDTICRNGIPMNHYDTFDTQYIQAVAEFFKKFGPKYKIDLESLEGVSKSSRMLTKILTEIQKDGNFNQGDCTKNVLTSVVHWQGHDD